MDAKITLRNTWNDYLAVRDLKPKTKKDHYSKLTRCVDDWLDEDMSTITKNMIELRHRELSGTPIQANSTMRVIRTLYNFALYKYEDDKGEPVLKRNPVNRLSELKAWNKERARSRHIPLKRMREWIDAVLMLNNTTIRDYLLVLLLTGFRHSECANMAWENVDFESRLIVIPETKNGMPHSLPMSSFLYALLQERHAMRSNDYVFPGGRHRTDGPMTSPYKAIAIIRNQTGIPFSPHDLRRTFLLVAEDLDIEEFIRKRLVNHTMQDVTGKHYSIRNPEQSLQRKTK